MKDMDGFVSLLILALVSFPLGSQERGEVTLVLVPPFPRLESSGLPAAWCWRIPKSPVSTACGASAEGQSEGNIRII